MHPADKGTLTELLLATRLLETGYSVSKPFGDNQRYDLILDDNGSLLRVQCKTARLRNGVVVFNTRSSSKFTNNGKDRHYRGEIELFGVYCPDNQGYYLVPVDTVGVHNGCLRVAAPKNNQTSKIRLAADFAI